MRIHSRTFTLNELLIIIAIIAVLMGMLLPALQKARDFGVSVKCANNLSQIMQGFHYYTSDYNQYLPQYEGGLLDKPAYTKWQDRLLPYLMPEISLTANGAYLNDARTLPRGVYACPAQLEGTAYRYRHYGMNLYMSSKKINRVTIPSARALSLDSNNTGPAINEPLDQQGLRHMNKENTAFVDGHTLLLGLDQVPLQGSYYFWGQNGN